MKSGKAFFFSLVFVEKKSEILKRRILTGVGRWNSFHIKVIKAILMPRKKISLLKNCKTGLETFNSNSVPKEYKCFLHHSLITKERAAQHVEAPNKA